MHAPEPNGAQHGLPELDELAAYEVFEVPEERLLDSSRQLTPYSS